MELLYTSVELDETPYAVKYYFDKGCKGDGYLLPDFKPEVHIQDTIPNTKQIDEIEQLIKDEHGIS